MKKTVSILLVLLLSLSLCACGSSAKSVAGSTFSQINSSAMTTEEAYWDDAEWDYAPEESGFSPAEEPRMAAGEDTPAERPGKIIYSADVQVETTDFDGSLGKLEELVQEYGGWVESSSINGSNYSDRSRGNVSHRSANYTLRFPSDRFDALMTKLSVLGNVPYTHSSPDCLQHPRAAPAGDDGTGGDGGGHYHSGRPTHRDPLPD